MNVPFVHLHNHSTYSLHDGAATVEELVEEARRRRYHALALTDHGVMHGAPAFFEKCLAAGIKPILGCEIYVHMSTPPDPSVDDSEPFSLYHFPLLIRNNIGYRNLCRLIASATTVRGSRVLSVPLEALKGRADGLIGLSGCLRGHIPRLLLADRKEEATRAAGMYADLFGKGNFYIELQNHGKDEENRYRTSLLELARRIGLPLVATNDSHFIRKEDFERQQLLIAIAQDRTLESVKTSNHYLDTYCLRTFEEMRAAFPETPAALSETVAIAERCNFRLDDITGSLPHFVDPSGASEESLLGELVEAGLAERGVDGESWRRRLALELDTVTARQLSGLFLMAWTIVRHARDRRVPYIVRGIPPSSLIGFLLGINEVDPIRHGLLPTGGSAPEHRGHHLSIEVYRERRQELLDRVFQVYGRDHAAHVAEFVWFHARAAIRECAKAIGTDPSLADRLLQALPADTTIARADPHLRRVAEDRPEANSLIDAARKVESLIYYSSGANSSTIALSSAPIPDVIPASISPAGRLVSHYDPRDLDNLGFSRIDFQGNNRELGVIGMVGRPLPETLEDPAAYELIAARDTFGVTPLDQPQYASVDYRPRTFAELIVLVALGRVAAREPRAAAWIEEAIASGRRTPEKLPELGEILASTGGAIVFQEQAEAVLGAFTDGRVRIGDIVRAATEISEESVEGFDEPGSSGHGGGRVSHPIYERLRKSTHGHSLSRRWRLLAEALVAAAPRLLSKASKAATALQTYRLADLKAKAPIHFMAALLTDRAANEGDVASVIAECRRKGIALLPADINRSGIGCGAEGEAIRLGLVTVEGVGEQATQEVVRARGERGRFSSFSDFLFAFDHRRLSHHSLEALVAGGCFTGLGLSTQPLLEALPEFIELKHSRERMSGQSQLFELDMADAERLEAAVRRSGTVSSVGPSATEGLPHR